MSLDTGHILTKVVATDTLTVGQQYQLTVAGDKVVAVTMDSPSSAPPGREAEARFHFPLGVLNSSHLAAGVHFTLAQHGKLLGTGTIVDTGSITITERISQ